MKTSPNIEHALTEALKELHLKYDLSLTRTTVLRCVLDHLHQRAWNPELHDTIELEESTVIAVITNCKDEPSFFNTLNNQSLKYRNRITKPVRLDIPYFDER